MPKTLLLIGGGHAHLHILKKLQSETIPDVKVTLISPSPYQYYSGMVSGYVEGLYTLAEIRVDLHLLTERSGVNFIEDQAVELDAANKLLITEKGLRLAYDAISFNIGSLTARPFIPGSVNTGTMVKPLDDFINNLLAADCGHPVVVVGGGASGIEISLALQARRRKLGSVDPVTLISAGPLLEQAGHNVSRKITEIVKLKGIRLYSNDTPAQVLSNQVFLQSGNNVFFQQLLWLTGGRAPSLFVKSALKVDDYGYLQVHSTLQSIEYANIYGAGDCISIVSCPDLPKAGVYSVREAPFLWDNLRAFFCGDPLKSYHPQTKYLAILSTGDQEAFLLYGNRAIHNKWCWKLKRKIDKAFVAKYQ